VPVAKADPDALAVGQALTRGANGQPALQEIQVDAQTRRELDGA